MTSTQLALPPESPFGRALLPGLAVSVGVLFALTRASGTPPFLTAFFGMVGVAYLPGLGAALWVENRFGLWASWILPLILSPVLAVGAGLLLTLSGVPVENTATWIVFLSVLAVALAPQPQREIEDYALTMDTPGFLRKRSDRQQVIALATLVLVLIAVPLLARDWTRSSGDAPLHVGVVNDILLHGFPPRDPLLAGVPLRTFWAFHAYLAILGGATRLPVQVILSGGSLVAAFVLVFTGYRFLNLLALTHGRSVWGAAFLFFSLNGAFWLVLPSEALIRPGAIGPRLLGELGLASPAVPLPGRFPPPVTFFIDQFVTAGPFVIGLVYLSLFMIAGVATLGDNRVRANVLLFMSTVGMLLFQGGVGMVAIAVTVVSIPVVWVAARLNPFRGPGWELTGTLLPMALALLVCAPYLAFMLRGAPFDPSRFLDLSVGKVVLYAAVLLPDLILSAGVLTAFLGAAEVRRQAFAVWAVLLVVVALVVIFPGKHPALGPVVLAHVPLSLAAGASIPPLWYRSRTPGRVVTALMVFLFLVPRTALGLAAYLHAPGPADRGPEAVELVTWLREKTPMDAVVVDGDPALVLEAGRTLLFGDEDHVRALGYPSDPVTVRRLTSLNLLRGTPLLPRQTDLLESFGAPIYVIRRLPAEAARPAPPDSREVFHNDRFAVYRWAPPGEGEENGAGGEGGDGGP
jgi:hypothetical protein